MSLLALLLASATGVPAAEPALPPGTVRIGTTAFRLPAGWHKKIYFTAHGAKLVAPLENKAVEIWPELPKSAANKILRREIRARIVARPHAT